MIFEKVSLLFWLKKTSFCVKLSTGVGHMEVLSKKAVKRSQLMFIFQATFEYLISILVAGSFLATLTKEIGIPDSVTGVISSIISLGCVFQLLSISHQTTAQILRLCLW